jgi:hypothetical protein
MLAMILKKINSPLLIILLLLVTFFPVLFLGKALYFLDISSLDQALITYAFSIIKKGEFPLFNPGLLSGIPLVGAYPSLFYPPMLLFLIFPFHFAYGLLVVSHFFLAGLGIFFILKHWNLRNQACLAGAVIFTFNGFIFESQYVYNIIFSSALIPWIFLYAEKLTENRTFKNFFY